MDHTQPRLDAHAAAPEAYETMLALESYLHRCGLSFQAVAAEPPRGRLFHATYGFASARSAASFVS